MQSDGGRTPVPSFRGSRSILSGSAVGVVGFTVMSYGDGDCTGNREPPAVIGYNMGGTSKGWWCTRSLYRNNLCETAGNV